MTRARILPWQLILTAALLAWLAAFPAQAHTEAPAAAASSAALSAATDVVSGTVEELVIEDRVRNKTTSYHLLRQDDGIIVPLVGTEAAGLVKGSRVGIVGRWDRRQFEVAHAETIAAAAPSTTTTVTTDVEGTLAIAHVDDFASGKGEFIYELHHDAGAVTTLEMTVLPSSLRGGMRVVASGQRSSDLKSLRPQYITILSDPSQTSGTEASIIEKAVTTNSVLVIMANFNNTVAPAYTQAQAQAVMTTNTNSVSKFYAEASYGQQLLNVTVTSSWVTMALPAACSVNIATGQIGPAAETAARNAGYEPNNYGFVVYLFPAQSCGWAGLAYVGYPHKAWINGTGYFVTQVVTHEMGHNFGLYHAGSLNCGAAPIGGSCSVAEYGDPWDTMGNQRAMHFNAKQKSLLNWIPSSSVKTHGSGSASYTLDPLELGGGSAYTVKIPTSNANRTYWVEFRQPIGFDSPLSSYPNAGAQIRVSSPFEWGSGSADDTEIVDMTPATSGTTKFNDSALVVGQTYTDGTVGVSITVTSASSSALSLSVTKSGGAATTSTITSSANPSTVGSSVTFNASVTGSGPTGTVNFKDGGTSIGGCGAVALSGSGNTRTAACSTASLAGGTHSITAAYSGDGANNSSTSAVLSQVVSKVTSTTGLATSLSPSNAGAAVTFTATVSGVAPTGTVNFKDGAASIIGCSAISVTGSGNVRTAQCATSALTVGTHSITVVYSGDASNTGSTSSALSQVVNKVSSTTGVASSLNPSTAGASVTFTATVTGTAPTGTVNFKDGASSITGCSAVSVTGSGNSRTVQCATSALTAGTHSITAVYSGDASNNSSTSSTLSQVVNGTGSTTSLGTSLNPSTVGTSVTFTVTVTGTSPTGTVNFKDGATSISACSAVTVTGSGNVRTAQCATSALTVDTHSITAVYSGDASNNSSTSSALSQVVNKVSSTTGVATSLNPSTSGASVTFTATVSGTAPTGTVNFKDGASSITGCSAVSVTGSGNVRTAQCATSALTVGTHSITAVYSGNATNNASTSSALSQVVNGTGSTTSLGTSLNPSTVGTSVSFTATVSGTAPTGTVNFKDGASSISGCSAVAVTGSGNVRTAACSTASLVAGTHSMAAVYSGDATNNASSSSALSQVVNGGGGAALVNASFETPVLASGAYQSNPSAPGIGWTFSSVSGIQRNGSALSGAAAPDGVQTAFIQRTGMIAQTVNLNAGNYTLSFQAAQRACCATPYGQPIKVSLDGTQIGGLISPVSTSFAAFSISFSVATSGAHTISFTGTDSHDKTTFIDAVSLGGSGSGLTNTTTTLASSLNPSTAGQSVSFTATVIGSSPTGSVAFRDGGVSISGCTAVALAGSGNTKTASCTTSSLAAGSHSIVANYTGDATNSGSTSSTLSQVMNKTPTTTALASSLNPSVVGQLVTLTATVTGASPGGTLNFTDGGISIAGCAAVALNAGSAQCATNGLSQATHAIVAAYGGDAGNAPSQSATLSQVVNGSGSGGGSTNVALAANGSVVTASSSYSSAYPASAINDGDRAGLNFGQGGVWMDRTAYQFPDEIDIDFASPQTINRVIVYSMQDNTVSPVDPDSTLTFTQRGITAFDVQAWSGAAWVTLGSVTGNNLVKRTVSFAATTTSKIRVLINYAANGRNSFLTEIEAWTH